MQCKPSANSKRCNPTVHVSQTNTARHDANKRNRMQLVSVPPVTTHKNIVQHITTHNINSTQLYFCGTRENTVRTIAIWCRGFCSRQQKESKTNRTLCSHNPEKSARFSYRMSHQHFHLAYCFCSVVCLKRWTVHLLGWTVICLISIMSNDGFALSEYVTPVVDRNPLVEFGTMSKAPKEKGSHFKQVIQASLRVPGPDHYKKDILEKSFTSNCKGGGFSKLSRSWNKHPSTPAVGQYKTENDHTTPRILGGSCPKKERGCHHFDEAVYHSKTSPAFAKYNADPVKNRVKVMSFTTPKTEARLTKKVSPIGQVVFPKHCGSDPTILNSL